MTRGFGAAVGIVIVLIVIVVVIGGFMLFRGGNDSASGESGTTSGNKLKVSEVNKNTGQENEVSGGEKIIGGNVVEITATKFSPNILTIKQGDTVQFLNKDSSLHWPASAMHPEHKVYPGSDIEKCKTADKNKIFDACKGLAQGEEFRFTFNEKGTWRYHDHLKVSLTGTIVVN